MGGWRTRHLRKCRGSEFSCNGHALGSVTISFHPLRGSLWLGELDPAHVQAQAGIHGLRESHPLASNCFRNGDVNRVCLLEASRKILLLFCKQQWEARSIGHTRWERGSGWVLTGSVLGPPGDQSEKEVVLVEGRGDPWEQPGPGSPC